MMRVGINQQYSMQDCRWQHSAVQAQLARSVTLLFPPMACVYEGRCGPPDDWRTGHCSPGGLLSGLSLQNGGPRSSKLMLRAQALTSCWHAQWA